MVDLQMMELIEGTLARLDVPVQVIDRDQEAVVSTPEHLVIRASTALREDTPVVVMGKQCIRLSNPEIVLVCDRNVPGAQEILKLSAALIRGLEAHHESDNTEMDLYRHLLLGTLAQEDVDAVCQKYNMIRKMERRVLIFHILQTDSTRTYDMLSDITPLEHSDILVEIDRHTVALIKEIADNETLDEAVQFAQALQETLMSETARTMTVGIGNGVSDLYELKDSYMEARRAIEVGRTFAPRDYIYAYSHLMLERFLVELPENIAESYLRVLFSPRTEKVLSKDIMDTIDTFFRKDLNLSDTARQLYIHRNTLVYRLDKVYRHTGLDLRKFDDAVTFRIFMELKKRRRKEEQER